MQKVLVTIKTMIKNVMKKEPVLSIAVILAVISMFVVHPDDTYASYIDFRTLAILFCLMVIVAGMREIGVFDCIAEMLLKKVKSISGIVTILVLLCFFLSMIITNDVALITFVPFALLIMNKVGEPHRRRWLVVCIVMQTAAANLGSMLTPIGNPQNLYLYGKAQMAIGSFLWLMLPYTILSLLLLLAWIWVRAKKEKRKEGSSILPELSSNNRTVSDKKRLIVYLILFLLSLLAVGHILSIWIVFLLVLAYFASFDCKILKNADYALLGTFTALFLFIGNLGRIPQFCGFLQELIRSREVMIAVAASQVMSNVPAAILLSGFTDQYQALIVGTNLGGLGTMIASMASLISFKYISREDATLRGSYFACFTAANLVLLAVLLIEAGILGVL